MADVEVAGDVVTDKHRAPLAACKNPVQPAKKDATRARQSTDGTCPSVAELNSIEKVLDARPAPTEAGSLAKNEEEFLCKIKGFAHVRQRRECKHVPS